MDLPAEPQIRWILRRAAALLEQGAEPVRGLILPTAAHFPDVFDGTPRSVAALLARMQAHAGLSDLTADIDFVAPEGEASGGGCSSGACGPGGKIDARIDRVGRRRDGSYVVSVGTGEVGNPMVLTTALARAVACMFMLEAGAYDELPPEDRERATDLAGVLLGFGVLLANGSHILIKGCGGSKVHSATRMPTEELGLALAIFCSLFSADVYAAEKQLDPAPREGFTRGAAWANANATLVRRLRSDAVSIARDEFVLGEARGWFTRVLGIGKSKRAATADETLSEMERAMRGASPRKQADPERSRKLAELRALVDESLETR